MQDVTFINIRTDEQSVSNRDGYFMVSGRVGDQLHFIKVGYERLMKKINQENIDSPLNVSLVKSTIQIPEIELIYKPTGNLLKDSKYLSESGKLKVLKSEMTAYMLGPLTEPLPDIYRT